MPEGYGSHADYMGWVGEDAKKRASSVHQALQHAFNRFIQSRAVEIITFSEMTAEDLAQGISAEPLVLKPLLAACNIAARAIERDLGIKNLDTYNPRLKPKQAEIIAGYIRPHLPPFLEIPTLCYLDRWAFVDKEVRKLKGQWEKKILKCLNTHASASFRKRTFTHRKERFELDAASPKSGDIELGIDVKRIEARRDIHKRCDEIVNKASNLKRAYPSARFGAVVYYPFIEEHANILSRLQSPNIACVVFASETADSIETAVKLLLSKLGVKRS